MGKFSKKFKGQFNHGANPRIAVSSVGVNDVHTVDPTNAHSLHLLSIAHDAVYVPAFPIPEERETFDDWMHNYASDGKNSRLVIILAGTNLDSPNPVIKGMSVAYYYPPGDAGLMAYVAIDPQYRNEGLGFTMVEARKQALLAMAAQYGKPLGGVFLECNDPEKVTPEEDSFDPATRIAIFKKWGAEITPIDYIQPPLSVGGDKCTRFKLLAYPHPKTGDYPTPQEINGFVRGIYQACAKYTGLNAEENADYLGIKTQLDAFDQNTPFAPRRVVTPAKDNKPSPPTIKPPANDR